MSSFNISGDHLSITPAIKEHAEKHLGKLEKVFKGKIRTDVILSVNHNDQKAEATVHIDGDKNPIFASAVSDDMYQSINDLEKKLMVQVNKYHQEITDHHPKHQ